MLSWIDIIITVAVAVAKLIRLLHQLNIYLGREAPSLKMHYFFLFFSSFADLAQWTVIGSRPDDTFFVVSRTVLE